MQRIITKLFIKYITHQINLKTNVLLLIYRVLRET